MEKPDQIFLEYHASLVPMRDVEINENTKLPARVVWGTMSVVIGGVVWLTTAFIHLSLAQADIAAIRVDLSKVEAERGRQRDEYAKAIYEIKSDLRLIKEKLKIRD